MLTKTFADTPLCRHVRLNNQTCGQPALKGRRFCRFHIAANQKRPDYSLPVVEDATSLQYAIMQVIRGLADKAIDHRTAALMLYGLQIACSNLKRFHQEQPDPEAKREESLAEILLNRLQKDRQEYEEQQKSSEDSPQQLGPDVPRLFGCAEDRKRATGVVKGVRPRPLSSDLQEVFAHNY